MDIEKIRKRRTIKVLIVDLIMAISVVIIVAILVAVVAGWRISADFTVEQNGLVSIKTKPTGATVFIDDEKHPQVSNTSKMLTGGEHKIVLEKEGYESWEKTIKITPGWLYRLEYPKLVKQNREKEELKTFASLDFFYVSPDRTAAIYSEENTIEWTLVTDFNNNPKYETINLKNLFTGSENGELNLEIKYLEWSKNGEKILINAVNKTTNEWGIINLKDENKHINLSKEYNIKISDAKFEDSAGEKILGLVENKITRVDFSNKTVSSLLEKVESFNFRENEIVYLENSEKGRKIKIYRIGEEKSVEVAEVEAGQTISFALTKFNSQNYLIYTVDKRLFAYRANDYPRSGTSFDMLKVNENDLGIVPTEVKTSLNNEFVIFRESSRVVVYDAELEEWNEYDYGDENVRFLDNYLLYRVDEASGKFLAWDFDSENVRTLVVDRGVNTFDALITENEKYFYYIGRFEEEGVVYYKLIREKL
ncbi:PEGA domain-containing protein [Candidatus Saccharibacteria bacterium]|nr:PEGA domain-containing protein [Candidatus Saccharibacteria bacterium]